MEDSSLNFDQPILSVRRRTPTLLPEHRDERKTNFSRPPIPRLPPHRPELKSGPIRNPGSVPFIWEQTPGQPKEEAKPHTQSSDRHLIAPKLPPGRYPKANQKDCDNLSPSTCVGRNEAVNIPSTRDNKKEACDVRDENVEVVETHKVTAEEETSDSGDSDAFVDALDTLSRTESAFLNCSISGLNELDNLDVKSSGNFSTDPQAQKFMMDRFLPAAKAMASDTVHYTPKRQPVVQEQPNQINKVVVNQYKPLLRYGPSFAKRYTEYCDNQEEVDSEDDDDQRQNMPAACGLLSRLCLKGSIGRLNPVPGMSVRTRMPVSSSYKTQCRSSPSGSYNESYETNNELRSDRTMKKSVDRVQVAGLAEEKTRLRYETTATYSDAPWPFTETTKVPSDHEEQTNAGTNDSGLYGKDVKTFQEVLSGHDCPKESDSESFVVEKTLYVDTVQRLESPNMNAQGTTGLPRLKREDPEIITKRLDQIHTAYSISDEFKKLDDVVGEEKLRLSANNCDDSNMSSFNKPSGIHGTEERNALTTTGTTEPVKEAADNFEKQLPSFSDLLAPPPLPKSPSDSWLLRTLPSVSKNSSLHSHLGAAKNPGSYGPNAVTNDAKWETIVKASKLQHTLQHHSVGLLTTIPEA